MSDPADQRRRHLDERRGEDVGDDQRPGAGNRLRPGMARVQPSLKPAEAGVLASDAQRVVVHVDGGGARHAEPQRAKSQDARARADIEQRGRRNAAEFFLNRLQAERCGRVAAVISSEETR